MYAIIEIHGIQAMLFEGRWSSSDAVFESLLNDMLDPDGPSGADPQPDVTEAERIAKELGGKVVEFEFDESPEGLVY